MSQVFLSTGSGGSVLAQHSFCLVCLSRTTHQVTCATVALYRHFLFSRCVVRVDEIGIHTARFHQGGSPSRAVVCIRNRRGCASDVAQHARRLDAHSLPPRKQTRDAQTQGDAPHNSVTTPRHAHVTQLCTSLVSTSQPGSVCHFISFHFISFHFISFHFISFHFISFHFISFHFISFHFISFHFISFHFISFHFISFHFISFHFISFHFISFHFISFHFISFHFISFHFISFNSI